MRYYIFSALLLALFLPIADAQNSGNNSINLLTQKKGVSIRALSIPNENTIWASGSKGSIALSLDGGKNFIWKQIKGYENRDFRSLHAWNKLEAIVAAIAAPAIVLKTKDGGDSWYKVYENTDTLMFIDAIHFKDSLNGTIVGDPIKQKIFLITSNDQGEHWQEAATYFKSILKEGEAFFASSNSNIASVHGPNFFVTGGLTSRLWINGTAIDLPIVQGEKSTGAYSMAINPSKNSIIIVGGDFTKKENAEKNITGFEFSSYAKPKWNSEDSLKYKSLSKWAINKKLGNPHGYKSSVVYINNKWLITCGTSGVDISKNKGKNWDLISTESFHVVQKQPGKQAVFLAGTDGRIGYLNLDSF
jgi:hypothetical protein